MTNFKYLGVVFDNRGRLTRTVCDKRLSAELVFWATLEASLQKRCLY